MTRAEALRDARDRLSRAGVREPALDAEWLLRSVLGCDRAALFAESGAPLSPAHAGRYRELIARRAAGNPVQHLTGVQEFWRRDFVVGPGALIPRPETELAVQAALDRVGGLERPLIVDVGTDVSAEALALAVLNRRRLGLEARVALHRGDLLAPVAGLAGRLDLVVSNPPYIDPGEAPQLAAEVRDHEPRRALFAPEGGLAVYRRLLPAAHRCLRPGGSLVVEVGAGMDRPVAALCEASGLEAVAAVEDLQGIPRVVIARRRGRPAAAAAPREAR